MINGVQLDLKLERLKELDGPDLVTDPRWLEKYKEVVQSSTVQQRSYRQLELAEAYRQRGYWNRWRFCIDSILTDSLQSKDGIGETATWMRLAHTGSYEMDVWQKSRGEEVSVAMSSRKGLDSKVVQASAFASPFDSGANPAVSIHQVVTNASQPASEQGAVISASYLAPVEPSAVTTTQKTKTNPQAFLNEFSKSKDESNLSRRIC